MPYDIFTPAIMDAVTKQVPKTSTFFKDTFFKSTKCLPTTAVTADFYKGKRRLAPVISNNATGKASAKLGFSTDTFETPLVKVKDMTTIQDIMKRYPGESVFGGITPQERGIALMVDALAEFEEQISRREEFMCVNALSKGQIPVIGEGVNYTIDFGFTNKSVLSMKWDAVNSSADPIADLKVFSRACLKNGYRTPNICVMEYSAYVAFMNRCMALGYLDQKNLLNPQIEPSIKSDNVVFHGKLLDPALEIYTYEEWFIDDFTDPANPTEKPMMEKGKIILASTNARFDMYYGVLAYTDQSTNTMNSIVGERLTDSWIQKDPDCRILSLSSRPLPIPREVDSWYVAEVSATV